MGQEAVLYWIGSVQMQMQRSGAYTAPSWTTCYSFVLVQFCTDCGWATTPLQQQPYRPPALNQRSTTTRYGTVEWSSAQSTSALPTESSSLMLCTLWPGLKHRRVWALQIRLSSWSYYGYLCTNQESGTATIKGAMLTHERGARNETHGSRTRERV